MSGSDKRKAPSSQNNLNKDLCDFLIELSSYERTVTRNPFKSNAYRQAASSLASHPTRISSGKEASAIKGIGKKISAKIDEFLTTGTLKKLEKIRADDVTVALTTLTRVSGVGPAKARQLYDAGITDLDALRAQRSLLNHHQTIGLRYVNEFERRIPRAEVTVIESAVLASLRRLPHLSLCAIVCGSYRRGHNSSGDVDVLLTYGDSQIITSIDDKPEIKQQPKNDTEEKYDDRKYSKKRDDQYENSSVPTNTKKMKVSRGSAKCTATTTIKEESTSTPEENSKSTTKERDKSTAKEKHRSVIKEESMDPMKKSKNIVSRNVNGSSGRSSKSDSSGGNKISSETGAKVVDKNVLQRVVEQLRDDGVVTDTLSLGDTKFMGVCSVTGGECVRRLDLRLLAPENYYCGVLYFTGSDLFNKHMRSIALEAGFTLNEYSLRPLGSTGVPGEPLPITSERHVFDAIGMTYKSPTDRNM